MGAFPPIVGLLERTKSKAAVPVPSDNPYASPEHVPEACQSVSRFRRWVTMWVRPRATIRDIIETDNVQGVWLLACMASVTKLLDIWVTADRTQPNPPGASVTRIIVGGAILGAVVLWCMSALVWLWNRSHGGVATFSQTKAALAWSCVPVVSSILLWIPLFLLAGTTVFTDGFWREPPANLYAVCIGSNLIGLILIGWQFVICSKMVGEINRYSAWKGAGALLLSMLFLWLFVLMSAFAVLDVGDLS